MMIKNFLFVTALLTLALLSGCATGGSGPPVLPVVTVDDGSLAAAGVTLSIPMTVTVTGTSQTAVTWSITGDSCTGTGNPCGTLTNATSSSVTYVAPPVVPSTPQVNVVATLTANANATGAQPLTIIDITSDVSPVSANIGAGLTQLFTANAAPDNAPQTFTWTCMIGQVACANFSPAPGVASPGLASYKPTAGEECTNNCVQISAASTIDPGACAIAPKNCTVAKASVVPSRLVGTSSSPVTFAFRFSGYDSSNHPVAVAGTFTVAVNGSISGGSEDELTSSGPAHHNITGGSFTPTSSDPNNSNNAGVLKLTTGASPDQFQAVLDSAGDISMIESDGNGTGSGIAEPTFTFKTSAIQTFAFGFTGVDSGLNRVGYVGVLGFNNSGAITGSMDSNDNGSTTTLCAAPPCAVTGTYTYSSSTNVGQIALTAPVALNFDFYAANGSNNSANPLNLYAISTDSIDATHAAVLGTLITQDTSKTYNTALFNGTSISQLTGVNGANTNVSLTLANTDGNGNFSGQFDQNNAGAILHYPDITTTPPQNPFAYTYSASSSSNGRYSFQLLGNPGASPVVPPVPFILYASAANRGFLLDQSSAAVMTGTMLPQGKGGGLYTASETTGTFAAATTSSGTSGVVPAAANFLLTSPGSSVWNVTGTQYPGQVTDTGTYTVNDGGDGTIVLTAPSAQNYVIYAVDTVGPCNINSPVCQIVDFMMIDVDKTNTLPNVIFARQ